MPAGSNNFQARYVIRHAWAGAIRCPSPVRGVWGSPPNLPGPTAAISAPQLGLQQAGDVSLGALLTGVMPPETLLAAAGATPTLTLPSAEAPEPVVDIDLPPPGPPAEPPGAGCAGCTAGRDGAGALGAGIAALLLAALRRRARG